MVRPQLNDKPLFSQHRVFIKLKLQSGNGLFSLTRACSLHADGK